MLRALLAAMANVPKRIPIPKNGVDYRGKVVLAPMVRAGELPSRLLALQYGADLVWGPETVDKSMIGTTRRVNPTTSVIEFTRVSSNDMQNLPPSKWRESVIYRIHPSREKQRLIFQIGTSSPVLAVQAAKLVAADVAGIDVNAGCPKPFSTSGGMGAALLRTPELLASILTALVKEVGEIYEIGISVKIRLLSTAEETEALVRRLCQTGITGLTVHCRTTPMRPRERAIRDQLRMIGRICKEEGVACVMNGDVKNRDEALALMQEYEVDGSMIATAAEANPSCFRTEAQGGLLPWHQVVAEYVKTALDVQNRYGNTKFQLLQLMAGKGGSNQSLSSTKSYSQACQALELHDLSQQAKDVDERLGITERMRERAAAAEAAAAAAAAKAARTKNKSAQAAGGNMRKERAINNAGKTPRSKRGAGTTPPMAV